MIRICKTPWFRRLWTLQEGVLTQDIYFQLQDRAVSMQSLIEHPVLLPESSSPDAAGLYKRILRQCTYPLLKLTQFRKLSHKERSRLIWSDIQCKYRTNLPSTQPSLVLTRDPRAYDKPYAGRDCMSCYYPRSPR